MFYLCLYISFIEKYITPMLNNENYKSRTNSPKIRILKCLIDYSGIGIKQCSLRPFLLILTSFNYYIYQTTICCVHSSPNPATLQLLNTVLMMTIHWTVNIYCILSYKQLDNSRTPIFGQYFLIIIKKNSLTL